MTAFKLTHNAPQSLSLHSTWHMHPDAKQVFFSVFQGATYVTTVSFTPDEARAFAKLLTEEADHIEKVGARGKETVE